MSKELRGTEEDAMTFKHRWKTSAALLALALAAVALTGCNTSQYAQSDKKIIPAGAVGGYLGQPGVAIIDMQTAEGYAAAHVKGAINIPQEEIVINVPVKNMLTSKNKIQKLLSEKGVTADTTMVVYDDNRMNAARFFWTMLMYGNENVLVVDGGLSALRAAGVAMTGEVPQVAPAEYIAAEKDTRWLATAEDVLRQVNEPDKNTVLLDVRTDAEYQESGKVPSSLMWDYANAFYPDGTFKDTQTTRINFIELGIRPENSVILYCQTSMRAAPVFLRLYDAGYRNLKIYDGAYLEWSQNPANPIERPAGIVAPSNKDAS